MRNQKLFNSNTGLNLLGLVLIFFFSSAKLSNSGIAFQKMPLGDAVTKAKSANKLVFISVTAAWCGPCRKLKNETFRDEDVSGYFNNNFISLNFEHDSEEGMALMRKYNIQGFPTLLILNSDGEVVSRKGGFLYPSQLLKLARRAMEK